MLSSYISSGSFHTTTIEAVFPYGIYTGQSLDKHAPTDKFGNNTGSVYDLGVDGAFSGYKLLILNQCGDASYFKAAPQALREKGFDVEIIYKDNAPSSAQQFDRLLSSVNQVWLISADKSMLSTDQIKCLCHYYNQGMGLAIWGDNDPLYVDANRILKELLGSGVYLTGNDPATQVLSSRKGQTSDSVGFDAGNIMFTGVNQLYEGVTIARVMYPSQSGVELLMTSSHKHPVTCIVDKPGTGKRLLIDGGFTRLWDSYWKDSAGTSRFVKNTAAWLCGIDSDWV